jgi:hypothetical protein
VDHRAHPDLEGDRNRGGKATARTPALRFFCVLLPVTFAVEAFIMIALHETLAGLSPLAGALADGALLVLFLFPLLYLLSFRPLVRRMAASHDAQAELEAEVARRTAALQVANEELSAQVTGAPRGAVCAGQLHAHAGSH